MKYVYVFFAFIFFFPLSSFAAGIDYGKIISQSADSFVLQYGNMENLDFYNCSTSALSCADVGKTLPPASGGGNIESASHFTLTTSSTWKNNIHTRYFSLINNIIGKTYTRSYKLSFWDMLSDEGTVDAISPDNKKMIYMDDSSGYPTLYQLNLTTLKGKTFKGTKLFSKSFTVSGFLFLTSPNDLYFMSNKDGSYDWNLYKYDFKTKTTSLIYKNVSYAFRMRKFGNGFTFFAIQGASSFPVFYNADTEKVEKFSGITADDSVSIINSKVMSFSGGVHGVLLTPQNFDSNTPHQLVVWLHGGPYRQTSQGFHPYASYAVYDLILNDLVKNNVVVLKLDYRGSYGYGGVFAKAIKGSVGNGDVSDVMTALSSVKKTMTISDSYLMGNSYGGYLALRGVVAYPKQFAGAISINGVTDWPTLVDQLQNSIFNSFFGGLPNKNNAKLYSKASIISRIPNLTDQKIVIIQAQADKTIPPSQADLLFNDLKGQGKNATFYPYAGEDHTFTKVNDIEGICKNVFTTLSLPLGNSCNFE